MLIAACTIFGFPNVGGAHALPVHVPHQYTTLVLVNELCQSLLTPAVLYVNDVSVGGLANRRLFTAFDCHLM